MRRSFCYMVFSLFIQYISFVKLKIHSNIFFCGILLGITCIWSFTNLWHCVKGIDWSSVVYSHEEVNNIGFWRSGLNNFVKEQSNLWWSLVSCLSCDVALMEIGGANLGMQRPIFCLLLGLSSDNAQSITGQVTEVICPVIDLAQPELTPSKRDSSGHWILQWKLWYWSDIFW